MTKHRCSPPQLPACPACGAAAKKGDLLNLCRECALSLAYVLALRRPG